MNRNGFTIIETIIAIVILTLAIPPMLWSLREAHLTRVNPALALQARWLATERMEDIIADRHSNTRGWNYIIEANFPHEPTVAGFAAFSRTVAVIETAADLASPGAEYKRIIVTVEWVDASSDSRSLDIETVLTNY